jgi:hypothetical protein
MVKLNSKLKIEIEKKFQFTLRKSDFFMFEKKGVWQFAYTLF